MREEYLKHIPDYEAYRGMIMDKNILIGVFYLENWNTKHLTGRLKDKEAIVTTGTELYLHVQDKETKESVEIYKVTIDDHFKLAGENMADMFTFSSIEKIKGLDGITEDERHILDLSARLWNRFTSMEQTHPSDIEEMERAIHTIQNVISSRIVRRDYPSTFTSYSKEDKK